MFYFNFVQRPSYALLKTNPKEYWEQWKDYTKSQLNYQLLRANMESDRRALLAMKAGNIGFNGCGTPCQGCTLGNGMGLFF